MISTAEAFVSSQFATAKHQNLICEFGKARARSFAGKLWAFLSGQANHLLDLKTITQGRTIRRSRFVGNKTVKICEIKGSEGRCHDFDKKFNPLKTHNQNRWIGIASAWERGIYLPAVELIKVGDIYIVRDGHHRVSVAKFMGCDYVDALVIEWELE